MFQNIFLKVVATLIKFHILISVQNNVYLLNPKEKKKKKNGKEVKRNKIP